MTHPTPDDAHLRAQGGHAGGGFQEGDNPPPQDRDKTDADLEDEDGEVQDRDDELLDEGLEETFPASDPVSSKHIT